MTTNASRTISFSRVSLGRLRKLYSKSRRPTDYVPQANDLGKVFELVWGIDESTRTTGQIALRFNIVGRQAAYYIEAGRELGFLQETSRGEFRLTSDGGKLHSLGENEALSLFSTHVLTIPVIRLAMDLVLSSSNDTLPMADLDTIVVDCCRGRYKLSTVPRRTECVIAWLRWLENNSEFVD